MSPFVIAAVGAGGKTTALLHLARALSHRAVLLTTKMCIRDSLYTGAVADAVKRFKFKHRQHYADWFAAQTLPVLAERLDTWMPDLVTFIPIGVLHWYQRGYNQAELLAQRIAAPFSLSCAATLWKRPFTPKQSGRKDAAAREKNAKRALWIRAGIDLSGKSVVLVDDIIRCV